MKKFKDDKKNKVLDHIIYYLVEEDFPIEHLNALLNITTAFNWSKELESDIFKLSKEIGEKLNRDINQSI